jgi:nucleoside-diphosphate-sugar epimerase
MTTRKLVAITGATGNLGSKLRAHFARTGTRDLRLLCLNPACDATVITADLSAYDADWEAAFTGVDTVVHLAGNTDNQADWEAMQKPNLDAVLNVLEASVRQRCRRLIFASSNWVMAGYRHAQGRITADLPPRPVNAYGGSKLAGERICRSYAERYGLSVIALRIGYCAPGENKPGRHMYHLGWGQAMWLSDRDFCHAIDCAIDFADVRFAVLNLMSDNPGMRWDIEETRRVLGWQPRDGHSPVVDKAMLAAEAAHGAGSAAVQALVRAHAAWLW